jgi:carbamoyltransferase
VLSVDGFGDFSSAAWGTGRQSRIDIGGTVRFPNSLGIFYQALTQYLGFYQYGDEYKVMGLAAYGSPSRLSAMRQIVRLANDGTFTLNLEYFRHHRSCVTDEWDGCAPRFGALFSAALEQLLGPRREPDDPITEAHRDIASATQAMYEEAFLHLIETKQRQTGLTDLALAGGCAMNSVANGKIRRRTAVRRLYVQAAAGDAGGAIGAAYSVWHGLGGVRSFVMNRADWGPEFDGGAIAALLALHHGRLGEAQCRIARPCDEASLCERVAHALADGQVVGWFQGRMEWGPRALGHRSILCDPRRADAKDLLNRRIKRRESFRPFAPSVLAEAVTEWFEDDGDVPFMSQVLPIRSGKRAAVPAVTHVDGSGRLQTVSRHANPRYHRLIEAFARITGVPMVLNTSFNENEPIVCDPAEALDCFLRTNMDMLVLGDTIIERPRGA